MRVRTPNHYLQNIIICSLFMTWTGQVKLRKTAPCFANFNTHLRNRTENCIPTLQPLKDHALYHPQEMKNISGLLLWETPAERGRLISQCLKTQNTLTDGEPWYSPIKTDPELVILAIITSPNSWIFLFLVGVLAPCYVYLLLLLSMNEVECRAKTFNGNPASFWGRSGTALKQPRVGL